MNQAKYDSLPPDLKKVIDNNSGAALSKQIGKIWDESRTAGARRPPTAATRSTCCRRPRLDKWAAATAPLYDEWTADIDKLGMPGKQMLQDARAMLVKHQK